MEAIQQFGQNIFGFQLEMGERRWYIIGCFLVPDNTSTIESVIASLKERPRGLELLVVVDFNANLDHTEGDWRAEDIVAALTTARSEDIFSHLLPQQRPWCQDRRTWRMVRSGREVRSHMDYIMGTYCCLFMNVAVQDPQHNSDH